MAGKKTLENWIREAMTDSDKEGNISAISLIHFVGTAEREIHTIRFGRKQWTPKDAADLFKDKASAYSQELPGIQQFCLLAFYAKNEPEARHPFTVNGELEFGGLATEGPTGTGLTQQAMRHSEAIIQMSYRQMGTLMDASNNMIRIMADREERLLNENHSLMELTTKLVLEKATSGHDFRMKELEHQRSTAERQKLLSIAPALVNSIAGRDIFPVAVADTSLIETLAEHLDEDKIRKLAEIIPPELWGPLASRFTEFLSARNKNLQTGQALLDKGLSGEADAAGEVH